MFILSILLLPSSALLVFLTALQLSFQALCSVGAAIVSSTSRTMGHRYAGSVTKTAQSVGTFRT